MKYNILGVFCLILALPSWANETVTEALAAFAWEKRQILLFTPTTMHPQYQVFMDAHAALREDFDDRKLQIWQISPEKPVYLDKVEQPQLKSTDFQTAYQVSPDAFSLILIGYDQGEKLRQSVVDIKALLGIIDQMPIRQIEMLKEN